MKAFLAVLALVAAVVADEVVQQPTVFLQPPVEHHQNKDFNAPWPVENSWAPVADPHQPIQVVQQSSSYYAPVNHGNHNQEDCHQDNQQVSPQYYQHQEQHHQYEQQTAYQANNSPASVEVKVTHPDWATSYSNVNRYNNYWPAPVQFVPAAPVLATPAPFAKPSYAPTSAPVPVYNHNVAKWNTWSNQPVYDIVKVPQSVAKYVAITPGSVHIAPLPGHTVSHKVLNVAPAGSW
ncbi:uncharacterized protein LOC110677059 [Aedes aegypti]|uniref:Uncharacterized protein n=1 Tax=Aedes aegypti TaxID=7159 RepID=A0A6I8U834_AEDAE|nr:uncharacterized protein LOC110677059 [Aedes aegypti]